MRFIVFMALLTASCGLPSHSNPDTVIPTADTTSLAPPPGEAPGAAALDNESLWKRVRARPDSVALSVAVNDTTNAFFVISGKLDSSARYFITQRVEVAFPNGRKQELPVQGTAMMWEEGQRRPYISMEDMNFDGSGDVHLFDNAGATGNFWYSVWLYSAKNGFRFSQDFSDLSAPRIDGSTRQILSYYRLGHCQETIGFFRVRGNKPYPVKYIFNQSENSNSPEERMCVTYKKEFIRGKWTVSKIETEARESYDAVSSN